MFPRRYVDPEPIRIWGHENCKKIYFDNYVVHCFWVEDKKLIFLQGCDQDQFGNSKRNSTNPKKGFNLDNATICDTSTLFVLENWKTFIHFSLISLWNSHPFVLKTCGKTPGDGVNSKNADSKIKDSDSKKSPNKKDREGGPGMLSNSDLMKNRCNNFHKGYKIAEAMTSWKRVVNIAELWKEGWVLRYALYIHTT